MILSIDPGAVSGGFAVFDEQRLVTAGHLPVVDGMISPQLFAGIFSQFPAIDEVVIERVGAMPGQGVSSTFKFGRGVGILEGVAAALGKRITYVAPTVWKRDVGVSADKEASRRKAMDLWPEFASLIFAKKKDHGPAEAALIGLWRVRQ